MAEAQLDALLVTKLVNVRYLTGFTGTSGWLWVTPDTATLLTDGRYGEQAAEETDAGVGVETGSRPRACLEEVLGGDRPRAGLEAARVTLGLFRSLQELGAGWVETREVVEGFRCRKDAEEIETIRRSLAVAEAALLEVGRRLEPGVTEREIAAELEYACRRRGADGMAFDTIVATGPRTALPHGVATERELRDAEPVMIDMGCVVDGYCSDITRMVWVGAGACRGGAAGPYAGYARVHRLVDEARGAAVETVAPGVSAREVDAAARRVMERGGLGDAFVHGSGHGLGLEIHETPALSPRSDDRIEEGMVMTVEPAAYLPGRFGVRIEDVVVVDSGGARRLTTLETDPILA